PKPEFWHETTILPDRLRRASASGRGVASSGEQVRRPGIGGRADRLPEESLQHEGVPGRIVAGVVVEGGEDLVGLRSDPPGLGEELPELRLTIEVVVLLPPGGPLPAALAQPSHGASWKRT